MLASYLQSLDPVAQLASRAVLRENLHQERLEPVLSSANDVFLKHHDQTQSEPTQQQQLQKVGLSTDSAQALLSYLEQHNDKLYHAGRLINGEAYVVTDQHRVYYGWPNALKPLDMAHWMTNRCIDYQIREYTAKNGIKIRVTTQDNHRRAQFKAPLPGTHLPIPQIKQAPFFGDTPEPLAGRARTSRDL